MSNSEFIHFKNVLEAGKEKGHKPWTGTALHQTGRERERETTYICVCVCMCACEYGWVRAREQERE